MKLKGLLRLLSRIASLVTLGAASTSASASADVQKPVIQQETSPDRAALLHELLGSEIIGDEQASQQRKTAETSGLQETLAQEREPASPPPPPPPPPPP